MSDVEWAAAQQRAHNLASFQKHPKPRQTYVKRIVPAGMDLFRALQIAESIELRATAQKAG